MITINKLLACIIITSLIIVSTSETDSIKYAAAITYAVTSNLLAVATFTLNDPKN